MKAIAACETAASEPGASDQKARYRTSFEILSACRYNAGGDVELAGIVTERCEKTFLPTLKPPGKRAYAKARKACERKYAGKQGTMYVSAQVICEAKAAVRAA